MEGDGSSISSAKSESAAPRGRLPTLAIALRVGNVDAVRATKASPRGRTGGTLAASSDIFSACVENGEEEGVGDERAAGRDVERRLDLGLRARGGDGRGDGWPADGAEKRTSKDNAVYSPEVDGEGYAPGCCGARSGVAGSGHYVLRRGRCAPRACVGRMESACSAITRWFYAHTSLGLAPPRSRPKPSALPARRPSLLGDLPR